MRAHQVQKEASKSSRAPHELINEATTPWDMFKLLVQVRENNMPNFFWELSHEQSPWRETYPSKENYFEALGKGEDNMVARDGYDLTRIRHAGPDVMLLISRGHNDSHTTAVNVDVVTLRKNELDAAREQREAEHWGWRVWQVDRHERKKSELEDELTFADLGYEWR